MTATPTPSQERFNRERVDGQRTLTMAVQSTCTVCGYTVIRDLTEMKEAEDKHVKVCSANVRVMPPKAKP